MPLGRSGLSCPASPQEASLRQRDSQGSQWDHARDMDLRSSIPFGRARSCQWRVPLIKGYIKFMHFHSNCLYFSVQRCYAALQQRTIQQRCGTWSLKLYQHGDCLQLKHSNVFTNYRNLTNVSQIFPAFKILPTKKKDLWSITFFIFSLVLFSAFLLLSPHENRLWWMVAPFMFIKASKKMRHELTNVVQKVSDQHFAAKYILWKTLIYIVGDAKLSSL